LHLGQCQLRPGGHQFQYGLHPGRRFDSKRAELAAGEPLDEVSAKGLCHDRRRLGHMPPDSGQHLADLDGIMKIRPVDYYGGSQIMRC